ncbi:MAG: triose-phosphate isomerase, partial [Pseudomonadota bacterium]|nr:triose-phosphate isomerase [Pseudomonadota bacterium]
MRSYLVAGNWKMNGSSAANSQLVDGILSGAPSVEQVDLLVCPPFPYIAEVAAKLGSSRMMLGAQNVSAYKSGAYTCETSGSMLKDVGCSHVIVGHSERRALYGESSEVVAEKYMAAQGAGLIPILCV